MPRFDGTGPQGKGPMTGRGRGFCVLTNSKENSGHVEGLIGLQGIPFSQKIHNFENTGKEVINMPFGDGTGPAGMGPMTGRAAGFCAGFPVPGYMNPIIGRAGFYGPFTPTVGPYGEGLSGYGVPYYGRGFGRGFGRGRGRGWGRGGGRRFW